MNIAVLGCGNMVKALFKKEMGDTHKYYFYSPSGISAKEISSQVNNSYFVSSFSDFKFLKIDYWLLGMKPQSIKEVSSEFEGLGVKEPFIISILAAISLQKIKDLFNTPYVIRAMPNIASKYNRGVTLLSATLKTQETFKNDALNFFTKTSKSYFVDEEHLDLLTPLTGSGISYFFLLSSYLQEYFIEKGIDEKLAHDLVIETMGGAYFLSHNDPDHQFQKLIDTITSKKGVTIEAIEAFKKKNLKGLVFEALNAALSRQEEISKGLG